MSPLILLLALITIYSPVQAKKKPKDFIKLCKRSDPELSKCMLESAKEAKNGITKGLPELNLAPMDPLFIPKMEMKQGKDNFKLDIVVTNMTLSGVSDSEFLDFVISKDLKHLNVITNVKQNLVDSDYSMNGKVLVLPVQGSGKSKFILEDIKATSNIEFEFFDKKGVEYFKIKSIKVSLEPGFVKLHFTNLFNGDKALGDSANKFFNENWKEAFNAMKELPQEGFAQVMKEYFNRALLSYPVKDWFLD